MVVYVLTADSVAVTMDYIYQSMALNSQLAVAFFLHSVEKKNVVEV